MCKYEASYHAFLRVCSNPETILEYDEVFLIRTSFVFLHRRDLSEPLIDYFVRFLYGKNLGVRNDVKHGQ